MNKRRKGRGVSVRKLKEGAREAVDEERVEERRE